MDLSKREFTQLIENKEAMSVSIYTPTLRTGETDQNAIRFKNQLNQIEKQLLEYGEKRVRVLELLEPAKAMLTDNGFWQHQYEGLAVFLSPSMFRYYELPLNFDELVVIAEHFHTKPLLPFLNEDAVFYVLALSQNQVRFLRCTHYSVWDITPKEVPSSLNEALKYDQPEKQQQFHTTGPGSVAIMHGHGVSKDYDKVSILRYFQQVNRGLQEVLHDKRRPLVIAAVDYLHPLYREANSYRHILEVGIEGNPEKLSDIEIKEQAWKIVQPYVDQECYKALKQYGEAIAENLVSDDLEEVVIAADEGRVSTLFIAEGVQQWGCYDSGHRQVELKGEKEPGLYDLLDFAAIRTLLNTGQVYTLEKEQVPGKDSIAAIFRYPI
jgi:hypothetical protein